jgi:hypothetical protein
MCALLPQLANHNVGCVPSMDTELQVINLQCDPRLPSHQWWPGPARITHLPPRTSGWGLLAPKRLGGFTFPRAPLSVLILQHLLLGPRVAGGVRL